MLLRTSHLFAALVLAVLLAMPAWAQSNGPSKLPDFFVNESKLPFGPIEGVETQRLWGVHGNAGYRIEVPESWNGDLVVYAHGYRGVGAELTVSNPSIREHLVRNGYAWAASSYSRNRYDVKAGVMDTHALTQFFNGQAGRRAPISWGTPWAATSPPWLSSSIRVPTTALCPCAA